jgi:ceramide glucosyltransferase
MISGVAEYFILGFAAIPFVYYLLVLYSSWRFFVEAKKNSSTSSNFTPPVSNLKPVRGLDPEAYENFASFCRQDYPDYEIVFCAGDRTDPAVPVIEKLCRDFPDRRIRLIYSAGHQAANDKVAKLARLVDAAQHDVLVINDADVRVKPDYLRSVVAPLQNPKVGGATCFYVSTHETTFTQRLQSTGMLSDFFPGILVAWKLDGVKFALGQTIVATRERIAGFGGYRELENRPADDLLVGRLIAEQGYEVALLPYVVEAVADFESVSDLVYKRLRWMTVMRHMRPWGHLGLVFTHGLFWCCLAVAIHPTPAVTFVYLGGYGAFRIAMTYLIGAWGLKQKGLWKKIPFVPVWDVTALLIWLFSFGRRTIRWRDIDYYIRQGKLVPASAMQSLTREQRVTGDS